MKLRFILCLLVLCFVVVVTVLSFWQLFTFPTWLLWGTNGLTTYLSRKADNLMEAISKYRELVK